ncbi:MAG TPA: hypothetical protein VF941_22650 [Clostridia bacterium]
MLTRKNLSNRYSSARMNCSGDKRLRSYDNANNNDDFERPPKRPKELWDGVTRPNFLSGVEDRVKNKHKDRASGKYLCVKCGKGTLYDKKDLQIDHIKNWRDYITDKCDYEEHTAENQIWKGYLKKDVENAYSDTANLQPLCRHHNSSKSGPKGRDHDKPVFIGYEE